MSGEEEAAEVADIASANDRFRSVISLDVDVVVVVESHLEYLLGLSLYLFGGATSILLQGRAYQLRTNGGKVAMNSVSGSAIE